MAATPDHITITVDQDALRAQVSEVVQEELRNASLALRDAADRLDSEFMPKFLRDQEKYLRGRWDAEQAKARGGDPT